ASKLLLLLLSGSRDSRKRLQSVSQVADGSASRIRAHLASRRWLGHRAGGPERGFLHDPLLASPTNALFGDFTVLCGPCLSGRPGGPQERRLLSGLAAPCRVKEKAGKGELRGQEASRPAGQENSPLPPSLLLGGLLCLTTRANSSNLPYKEALEAQLASLEQAGKWKRVLVRTVDQWERATSEQELPPSAGSSPGFIPGAIYLYRKQEAVPAQGSGF
ncbi:uncharacterized protein LOC123255779, partial [Gracilinanus agilis]|uniref:uncharacterized protein LOC123255779 n=1 Tax=Gracilinanus agilis TaxID=191870 RepID=UPI001CFC60F9